MFQVSYFLPHKVSIFHPPELNVSMDILFDNELLFAWGMLADPHYVKSQIGRYVPFAWAVVEDYVSTVNGGMNGWEFSLIPEKGGHLQGAVLIGLTESEYEKLDSIEQVPIHRRRDKIRCRIGNIERIVYMYLKQGALLED